MTEIKLPEDKEQLLRIIVGNDFDWRSPLEIGKRLRKAQETPQTAIVAAEITISDLKRKALEIKNLRTRLKNINFFVNQISGYTGEIEQTAFDCLKHG
jgi:hypothetical protein